ncbi:Sugar phosphate exchanger 3 [Varanus komodoensis]|nr:Sugar phosphate exchanger 3 [Varanus komodoensis]
MKNSSSFNKVRRPVKAKPAFPSPAHLSCAPHWRGATRGLMVSDGGFVVSKPLEGDFHHVSVAEVFPDLHLQHLLSLLFFDLLLHRRGFVFGLWSACASVGNILGAFLASSVLQYGYEYAFLVTASVQFAGGVIVFFGLVISPKEIGLPEVGEETDGAAEEGASEPLIGGDTNEDDEEQNYSIQATDLSSSGSGPQPEAIGFFQACCLPGVILYSLAYACLKLVNYSFFFWLPFYLSNNFGWKEAEADKLSIWYDVGGIIGGTIQGLISDMLQKRAPVLAISLTLAVVSLFGYSREYFSARYAGLIRVRSGGACFYSCLVPDKVQQHLSIKREATCDPAEVLACNSLQPWPAPLVAVLGRWVSQMLLGGPQANGCSAECCFLNKLKKMAYRRDNKLEGFSVALPGNEGIRANVPIRVGDDPFQAGG